MSTKIAGQLLLSLALAGCGRGASGPSLADKGRMLATQRGCVSCHTTDGKRSVGPTWRGLYGSQVRLSDGKAVKADETYLRESMLDPSAKTVEGFQHGLMASVIKPGSLSGQDAEALVSYIKSLK